MLDFVAVQRTVQCQSCTDKHGTPPYVDLSAEPSYFTPARHPTHCPRCGKVRTFHPYDYADTLCQDYFGLSRASAIQAIQLFNSLRQTDNQRRTYKYTTNYDVGKQVKAGTEVNVNELAPTPAVIARAKRARDIFEYLDQSGVKRVLQRGYIAPLDCTCKMCGGQFTLIRGIVDTQATPPLHCVWCGARSSLITDPTQTEDTAWIVLSQNYGLPIPALKIFYDQWQAHISKHPTFSAYMQTEEVQKLLPLLQQAQQAQPSPVA